MSIPRLTWQRVVRLITPSVPLILLGGAPLAAQNAYSACYVPLTGTVYRIKDGNLKTACTTGHVEFTWTDGVNAVRTTDPLGGDLSGVLSNANVVRLLGRALSTNAPQPGQVLLWNGSSWIPTTPAGGGGVSDHGALAGLGDDDHPQYLLSNGTRNTVNGFAVTGTFRTGTIPIEGPGVRVMWYPGKAAFRAGTAINNEWDDTNIGVESVAFGFATKASGLRSAAFGQGTAASGSASLAFGLMSEAAGSISTAIGSLALSQHDGSFVYSDASDLQNGTSSSRQNQFVVRAQHFWFGNLSGTSNPAGQFITTSTGAYLSTGGTWTNSSDVASKNAFRDVDADDVLNRIAQLPIRSWSYKAEDPSIRHIGPTAQDFRAAFGLGNAETSIATVDADGISLLGIQALARWSTLQASQMKALDVDNAKLRAENAELRARLDRIEALLQQRPER